MIRVTDRNGLTHLLAPAAIARITEAGASSQWHGIRAYVKTFDGATIETQETALEIGLAIDRASRAVQGGGS